MPAPTDSTMPADSTTVYATTAPADSTTTTPADVDRDRMQMPTATPGDATPATSMPVGDSPAPEMAEPAATPMSGAETTTAMPDESMTAAASRRRDPDPRVTMPAGALHDTFDD